MLKKYFSKKNSKSNEAYRIIYDMFYDRVYKSAYYITRDIHLAQDAVQDTFLKAFRNMDHVEDGSKVGPWLATIATRTAIDLMRKQQRWNGIPTDDVILETASSDIENNWVEDAYESIWKKEQIFQEIKRLKPEYRQALLLKYKFDMKDEEIAVLLELKVGTVKSRIHRGKQKIKAVLKAELDVVDGDL